MKTKQIVKYVSGNYFDELLGKINDQLNDYDDIAICKKIDYFNMEEEKGGIPSAFLFFEFYPEEVGED